MRFHSPQILLVRFTYIHMTSVRAFVFPFVILFGEPSFGADRIDGWRWILVDFQMCGDQRKCPRTPSMSVLLIAKVIFASFIRWRFYCGSCVSWCWAADELGFSDSVNFAGEFSSCSDEPDDLFVRPESNFVFRCNTPPLSVVQTLIIFNHCC